MAITHNIDDGPDHLAISPLDGWGEDPDDDVLALAEAAAELAAVVLENSQNLSIAAREKKTDLVVLMLTEGPIFCMVTGPVPLAF